MKRGYDDEGKDDDYDDADDGDNDDNDNDYYAHYSMNPAMLGGAVNQHPRIYFSIQFNEPRGSITHKDNLLCDDCVRDVLFFGSCVEGDHNHGPIRKATSFAGHVCECLWQCVSFVGQESRQDHINHPDMLFTSKQLPYGTNGYLKRWISPSQCLRSENCHQSLSHRTLLTQHSFLIRLISNSPHF